MRALICPDYGPPEILRIETLPDPQPEPGQVVVNVRAAALNYPDLLSIAGRYQVKTPVPFVPGLEAAGVISAVGEGVNRLQVGDKVMLTPEGGAFAQRCAVDQSAVTPLPAGLDFAQAAGFSVTYGTSYHALVQCANLAEGETLLVLGAAGGVGVAAVEIGKALGARVIAAASSSEKCQFAREAGADETIQYGETDLKQSVRDLTGGRGADVVYDPVGGDLAQQALRSLGWQGRYLVVGFASGEIPSFAANLPLLKAASIIGVFWGAWAKANPARNAANFEQMTDLILAGALNPRATESYPLEDFLKAFASLSQRRVMGKVVLTFDDSNQD